ncbi:MAG: CPBP family intramembrane metalloprotease [Holophagaceae bacterium]|nr:CPBP family intramembrane metalloprotease [Holophagaceae bacterium]
MVHHRGIEDTEKSGNDSKLDRQALELFFGLTACFAAMAYLPIVRSGSLKALGGLALLLLMWSPGLAGIITAGLMFRSFRPLGVGGNSKLIFWAVLCLLLPVAYTLVIYPTLAVFGLVSLGKDHSVSYFVFVFWPTLLTSLGEELGWRGFAAPVMGRVLGFRLGQTSLRVIWFIFHLPALLLTDYGKSPHMVFGNAMFLISVVALSIFLGWARERSDSVWPCAFFHASHNLIFLHLFDPMKLQNASSTWLVGEQGLLLALVLAPLGVYAFFASRKPRQS